jgi:CBS domain containing-hemolysin-like protein
MTLLLTLGLLLITLLTISLERTYYRVKPHELKRRAREGDPFAVTLYRAVAYGASLRLLLWALVGTSAGAFFVVMSRSFSPWLAFLIIMGVVWFGFAWLPNSRVTVVSAYVAKWLAGPFGWLLNRLHPVLDWLASLIRRYRPLHFHSGLYRKEDLLALLNQQATQFDNKMSEPELDMAKRALQFGDRIIRDVMVPRRAVRVVSVSDTIGPILIDELHKSGHSRFPVYDGKKDNIVGTLYLRDLVGLKAQGSVKDVMKKKTMYVHEDQSLQDVLQAIIKTHHQMFVVVNSFEEFVGVIGLEDLMEQIVGQPIMDEFDRYEDLRAVAERAAKTEHQQHPEPEVVEPEAPEPEKPTSDEASVVE